MSGWTGNPVIFRTYLEGRTDGDGKKPVHSPLVERYNLTFDKASKFDCFGAVLNKQYIDISFDDKEMYSTFLDMAEEKGWKCLALPSTHGGHTFWKNEQGRIKSNSKQSVKVAVGFVVDIHGGDTYIPLRVHGKDRFPPDYELFEGEVPDEVPFELIPVKTTASLWRMENSEGRNSVLFPYILTLQGLGLTVEQSRECIREINKYIFKDPLPEKELETVLRDEAFDKPVFYEDGKFRHDVFAEFLIAKYHIKNINGYIHSYQNGCYVSGFDPIEVAIQAEAPILKRSAKAEVLDYIRVKGKNQTNRVKTLSPEYILFRNGVLNVETLELLPFSPDYVVTNMIPWDYNPYAKSDLLERVLNDISCSDSEIRAVIEEMGGYCLYRSTRFKKAFILTGEHDNGKSTIIDMICSMLGRENVSSLDMKELGDRFKTAMLFGKLANLGDDISNEYNADLSLFKKIVSGDLITAEFKGKDAFKFAPYATCVFSANDKPRLNDPTGAAQNRFVIVPLNAKFVQGTPNFDPKMREKVKAPDVIEAFIVLAVNGLRRVLQNDGFTQSAKGIAEAEEYRRQNNPVLSFVDEVGEDSIENHSTEDVYIRFDSFCSENGFQKMNKVMFVKRINQVLETVVQPRKCSGKSVRCFIKP